MYQAVFAFGLGDRVRDRISGLQGIIASRTQHLYGCVRYWILPEEVKDGKPLDGAWLDEPQLELVEARVHVPHNVVSAGEPTLPAQRGHGFDLPSPVRR